MKNQKTPESKKREKAFIVVWVLIVVILILLILLMQTCNGSKAKEDAKDIIVGGYAASDIDKLTSKQASSNSTTFSGRTEYYVKPNDYVPFYNSNEKQTLIYEIKDSDEHVVFKSEAIAPQKEARWYLEKAYKTGDYTFFITQAKVNADGTLGNAVTSTFKLIIY